MTFEELAKANAKLKTTDIKGKAYVEVNERIKAFRQLFPNGTITTEIMHLEDGVCVIKATAMASGVILGTGHAYEKEGSTFINKTSYIENAETSAVGRALGMVGIGIDTSVASYEEVANAMENQSKPPKPARKKEADAPVEILDSRAELRKLLKENGIDPSIIIQACGLNKNSTDADYQMALVYAKNLMGGNT